MPADDERVNPFNFRRPVADVDALVGRRGHLRWFEVALTRLEQQHPSNGLFIAPSGYGKTSTLNAFDRRARLRGFLPVRVTVNGSLASSAESFFESMLTAAMIAAEDAHKAQAHESDENEGGESAAFQLWLQQVGRVEGLETPFFFSLAQPYVDPSSLLRDCAVVSNLVASLGLSGLVVLIDDLHVLGEDDITTATLGTLLDHLQDWMFVGACTPEFVDDLAATAPDLLGKLDLRGLEPILSVSAISQIVLGPLGAELRDKVDLQHADIYDIAIASRGNPRLLQTIAYHMWGYANFREFKTYDPATAVLRAMLLEERKAAPRGDDIPEWIEEVDALIDSVHELSDDDLVRLEPVVSLDALTLNEVALATLAREGVEHEVDTKAAVVLAELEEFLDQMDGAGVIERTEDRFSIRGGGFGEAYLRRRIVEQTGKQPPVGALDYSTFVSAEFGERMATGCGMESDPAHVVARLMQTADAHTEERLTDLVASLASGDVMALENTSLVSLHYDTKPPSPEADHLVLAGVVLRTGIDDSMSIELSRVEWGTLWWCKRDVEADAVVARIEDWFNARAAVLRTYRLEFVEAVAEVIAAPQADQIVAVAAPFGVVDRAVDYYKDGRLSDGIAYLERVASALEFALEQEGTEDIVGQASDAYQRLGFFAGVLGDADRLEKAIVRTRQLRNEANLHDSDGYGWLDVYNAGFLRALRREYAAAADRARQAKEALLVGSGAVSAYMLLYFPEVTGWHPPRAGWNTAQNDNPEALIDTQALVYDALAGRFNLREFDAQVGALQLEHPAQKRLVAWTLAAKYQDFTTAQALLSGACSDGDDIAPAELEFVRGLNAD